MLRVIIAGVAAGVAVFFAGFVDHEIFNWSARSFSRLKDEAAVSELIAKKIPDAGIYGVPQMSEDYDKLKGDAKKKEDDRVGELYKKGPVATIIVAPTGQEMMSARELGGEAISNIAAALLVAWMVSQSASSQFVCRWLMSFAFGLASWLSIGASHYLWYRFPWAFERDELFCSLFEWAVAGLVIAAVFHWMQPASAAVAPAPALK